MTVAYQQTAVTVATATTESEPQTTSCAFPPATVNKISVQVPPGVNGVVSFQIWCGGGQIIPATLGQWVSGDNYTFEYEQTNFPDSGAWALVAYNEGNYEHTLTVVFETDIVSSVPTIAGTTLITSDVLEVGS